MEINLPNEAYMLPEDIPNWPPVWWFWIVLLCTLSTLFFAAYMVLKRRKRRAYRRKAMHILKQEYWKRPSDTKVTLCHELIRRCLLSQNRVEEAALPIDKLIPNLDRNRKKFQFANLGEFFISGNYNPKVEYSDEELAALYKTTEYWIKTHHD